MNIEIFTLCDAATEAQGKLNILGTFDTIWARQVPTIHPQCAVVIRLRFSRIEAGDHKIILQFVDEDGKELLPSLQGNLQVKIDQEAGFAGANLILNIQGLQLPKIGEYSFDLAVDSIEVASLPLMVKQAN